MLRTVHDRCSKAGSPFLRTTAVLLIGFATLFLALGSPVFAQVTPGPRYRILIDASKDGGLWWFPQAGTFDVEQYHQGRAFADSLRQDGAEVVELGRGVKVTTDILRGFDLVIRVPVYFRYSASEALAYQYTVAGGTRLLILGGASANGDGIAEAFGLSFEKRSRFTSLKRWAVHPFNPNVDPGHDSVWSGLASVPPETVTLGWIDGLRERPAFGYLPYGQSYVFFTGQSITLHRPSQSIAKHLVDSIKRYSLTDLTAVTTTDIVTRQEHLSEGPVLIAPQRNAYLPQPGKGEWRFDWDDVPEAESYELVILGRSASVPLGRVLTKRSEIIMGNAGQVNEVDSDKAGYIADHNLMGWSWRVRAKLSDGSWTAWSKEQLFNVQPRSR